MKFSDITERLNDIKLLLLLAVLLTFATPTEAQMAEYRTNAFSGVTSTLATNASYTCTNSTVVLRKDRGLSIWASFVTTNTVATGNVTFNFVAGNGSVYGTSLITATFPLNGTNTVIGYTNFPATVIGNARSLKLYSITNAETTNAVTVNWVQYGHYY
jgi:hypothetical protein